METKKIAIGADHAGYALKEKLKAYLSKQGWEVIDMGTHSDERADYPDFAHLVAKQILDKHVKFGLLMCGSGNGINITANKHQGIRAALVWNPEIASLARAHNDANILTLPARYLAYEDAILCLEAFLNTSFEGGRHTDRILKIDL